MREIVQAIRPVLPNALISLETYQDGKVVLTLASVPATWVATGVELVFPGRGMTTAFYPYCAVRALFTPEPTGIGASLGPPGRFPWSSGEWLLGEGREPRLLTRLRERIEQQRRRCLEEPATPAGFIQFVDPAIQEETMYAAGMLEALAYAYLLSDRRADCLRLLQSLHEHVTPEEVDLTRQERAKVMAQAIREGSDMPKQQLWAWRDANVRALKDSSIDI